MTINGINYYLGMAKEEILEDNGIGENKFPYNLWYYVFKKRFLFGKEVLFIEFEDDIVVTLSFRTVYGKIKIH